MRATKKTRGRVVALLVLAGALILARGILDRDRAREDAPPELAAEVSLESTEAELVRSLDGDSAILRYPNGERVEVRIHGIDAPEKNQAYSNASRRALERSLRGKAIVVIPITRDRYDRVVAKLIVDGRDVGLSQIEAGLAWHYRRYANEQLPGDNARYSEAQARAERERTGLWHDPKAIEPEEFRRKARGQRSDQ